MPSADDQYTPSSRQPLRRPLRHAPSTPLLQHLPHPSYEYTTELKTRYNPRPPPTDHYVAHKLQPNEVHWSGAPRRHIPAIAIPTSSNASAYGDPNTAAHLVTATSFDPAFERERGRWKMNPANSLQRPSNNKDTIATVYENYMDRKKSAAEMDGAGDIRKLLQGSNITSLKNRVSQDFRRVLGRRSSEAQMSNRYSDAPDKSPLDHLRHLLPSRARARREEEEARRKEAEAFLRSGKRNAGHSRIIQIPPHHHMNPEDSLSSGDGEEYFHRRTQAEIAEDRKRVGEFLFGDRPTLHLTERRSKQKRATGVSDSIMDPYLHKPLPVPAITKEQTLRRISLPVIPRIEQPRKMSLGGGRYPRLERKQTISGLRSAAAEDREVPVRQSSRAAVSALPERKYSGTLRNSRRRSVTWKQPAVESQTQGSETAEIRSVTSSLSYERDRKATPTQQRRGSLLRNEEQRPSPPSSQDLGLEPESPQLGHRAATYLNESESFWDTADSLLPYTKTPRTYKDIYAAGQASTDFWNEADETLELPPWRQSSSNLDQWLDNLPSWDDGFLQEFSESVKAEASGRARDSSTPPYYNSTQGSNLQSEKERRKSEAPKTPFHLQAILEENTASRSDADTPTSIRNLPLKKPKQPSLQPTKESQNETRNTKLRSSNLYSPPSPPKTGENSAKAGVEVLSSGEVEEISQSLVNKLSELEMKWKHEGVEMNGVLKRMLYVVDKLVLDDWAEEQRRERSHEMGWSK